jgi:hypothetical protein
MTHDVASIVGEGVPCRPAVIIALDAATTRELLTPSPKCETRLEVATLVDEHNPSTRTRLRATVFSREVQWRGSEPGS